ncbi:hypothetical protein [Prauserella cavernicola]|uniref:Uncharacterized protein n=1 Tax=Prauserella cavernicola TaxID=2800127 RepID=A0A934V7B5_9PSEU|nr:hypothetical protein [Prauserella cavernicola]MBK1787524.1 hypothetical protein [Prauserella cavernicola]
MTIPDRPGVRLRAAHTRSRAEDLVVRVDERTGLLALATTRVRETARECPPSPRNR